MSSPRNNAAAMRHKDRLFKMMERKLDSRRDAIDIRADKDRHAAYQVRNVGGTGSLYATFGTGNNKKVGP